jgi:hypothetical protein
MWKVSAFAGGLLCLLAGSYIALAQAPAHPMSFFVTSVGLPGGANMGGIAGADAHCQALATAAGASNHTWRAYLSVQERAGQPAINARDRIGKGPWYNAKGVMIAKDVDDLHAMKSFASGAALNEKGVLNPGRGAPEDPDDKTWPYMQAHPESMRHEILTGSTRDGRAFTDGRDHTCNNWTSDEDGNSPQRARFNTGPGAEIGKSDDSGPWNSQGISGGCTHVALARSHGAGLFYCFASD